MPTAQMSTIATVGIVMLQKALERSKVRVVNTLANIYWMDALKILLNDNHRLDMAVGWLLGILEWDQYSWLVEGILDVGTILLEFENTVDRATVSEMISAVVVWILRVAVCADRTDDVENMINRVARKQIKEGQLKERNEENNGEQNTVDSPEDLQ
jgi:hypothetical protein